MTPHQIREQVDTIVEKIRKSLLSHEEGNAAIESLLTQVCEQQRGACASTLMGLANEAWRMNDPGHENLFESLAMRISKTPLITEGGRDVSNSES